MQIQSNTFAFDPEPQYGSVVSVLVNNVSHPGIYVGGGFVIDNSQRDNGVKRIPMEVFRGGRKLRYHGFSGSLSPEQVVENAYAAIGQAYDFYLFNCKDFVRMAQGRAWVSLLTKTAAVLAAGSVVYAGVKVARRA